MSTQDEYTVWHAFYDVLRAYKIDRIFGNPGSTEETMLKQFPKDFEYIFALQEASVVAMADGYSQAARKLAVVSLHTAAGTGNAMCSIMTAFCNKTPLLIIAGQQARTMLVGDPFLCNRSAVDLPRPWVKWAYEPARPEDVPAAIVRGITTAMAAPAVCEMPPIRSISQKYGPDPVAIANVADALKQALRPALVLGPEIDRSLAWNAAIALAEYFQMPVYQSPACDRAVFPETHRLFAGPLPPARGILSKALSAYDLLLVLGAEIWRYYPWVPGDVIAPGTKLIQITNDPHDASAALVGSAILSDVGLALDALNQVLEVPEVPEPCPTDHIWPNSFTYSDRELLSADDVFKTIAERRRPDMVLLQETPSNAQHLLKAWPATQQEFYFTFASGGLGWAAPAAVGVAMARPKHTVVLAIGDGSLHYSVQSIHTAVQHKLKILYLVLRNEEYAVLKEFAVLENTPNVPALDLVGLDAVAVARAYGCFAVQVSAKENLQHEFEAALERPGPTLIEVVIDKTLEPLMGISV